MKDYISIICYIFYAYTIYQLVNIILDRQHKIYYAIKFVKNSDIINFITEDIELFESYVKGNTSICKAFSRKWAAKAWLNSIPNEQKEIRLLVKEMIESSREDLQKSIYEDD